MRSLVFMLLIGSLALGGCGRVGGWFGRSAPAPAAEGEANPLIPRRNLASRPPEVYRGTQVQTVTAMSVERIKGGAIIRATGVTQFQGGYDARLVLRDFDPDNKSDVVFDFMVVQPRTGQVGAQSSREITVGAAVTDQELEGVRRITVSGAQNARTSRR